MTIFFPPGTYRITRPISEHGPLAGTSLKGNGAMIVGPGKDKPVFDINAQGRGCRPASAA